MVKKDRFRNFIARKDRALTDPTVLAEELMEVTPPPPSLLSLVRPRQSLEAAWSVHRMCHSSNR